MKHEQKKLRARAGSAASSGSCAGSANGVSAINMKRAWKKAMSLVLTLAMVLSVFAFAPAAVAAEDIPSGGATVYNKPLWFRAGDDGAFGLYDAETGGNKITGDNFIIGTIDSNKPLLTLKDGFAINTTGAAAALTMVNAQYLKVEDGATATLSAEGNASGATALYVLGEECYITGGGTLELIASGGGNEGSYGLRVQGATGTIASIGDIVKVNATQVSNTAGKPAIGVSVHADSGTSELRTEGGAINAGGTDSTIGIDIGQTGTFKVSSGMANVKGTEKAISYDSGNGSMYCGADQCPDGSISASDEVDGDLVTGWSFDKQTGTVKNAGVTAKYFQLFQPPQATTWRQLSAYIGDYDSVVLGDQISASNATAPLVIEAGRDVTLDLKANRIINSKINIITVESGGKLTLTDTGTAGMIFGGEVTGDNSAGAVYVKSGGTFIMKGGSIINNIATGNNCAGGVYVEDGATFKVSGKACIWGNETKTLSGSTVVNSNVYLKAGALITVDGSLESDASIGVSVADLPTNDEPLRSITGANGADYSSSFPSDDDNYSIWNSEDNTIYLAYRPTVTLTAPAEGVYKLQYTDAETPISTTTWTDYTVPLTVDYGKKLWIRAVEDTHHVFAKWSDGSTDITDNPTQITVTGDVTYTPTMAPLVATVKKGTAPEQKYADFAKAWNYAAGSGSEQVTFTLYDDWTAAGEGTTSFGADAKGFADGVIHVPSDGEDITIDLNGHSIDRAMAEKTAAGKGNVILVDGELTVKGSGDIKGGNSTTSAGGVVVSSGGTFNMESGKITGNKYAGDTEQAGGGVLSSGIFKMKGGEISGNTASKGAGGVYYQGSAFKVSGAPKITGNTKNDVENNVYLPTGKSIAIDGSLTTGASIGVTTQTAPTAAAPIDIVPNTTTDDVSAFFKSDLEGYYVKHGSITQLVVDNRPEVTLTTAAGVEKFQYKISDEATAPYEGWVDYSQPVPVEANSKLWIKAVETSDHLFVKWSDGSTDITSNPTQITVINNVTYTPTMAPLVATVKKASAAAAEKFADLEKAWEAAAVANEAVTFTLYKDWTAAGEDKTSFGADVGFAEGVINVPSGKDITIDLNGHSIDRAMAEKTAAGKGNVISVDGELTVKGSGDIKGGNSTSDAGGVIVIGIFNMQGGKITGNNYAGNSDQAGGGVSLGGTFNMSGGEISGNTASKGAGGVYYQGSAFNVSGAPKITGNTVAGSANNVYLPSGKTLTVTSALTEGALIGVTAPSGVTFPVAITGINGDTDYSAFFTSDSSELIIVNSVEPSQSQVMLTMPPSAAVEEVVITGTVGTALAQSEMDKRIVIHLEYAAFDSIDDVGSWINLPAGITVHSYAADASNITIKLTGTPTEASSEAMTIVIPAEDLLNATAPLTVTHNPKALWSISAAPPPQLKYNITVAASPAEGGTVAGGGEFAYASRQTITATPADGWRFVRWTENGDEISKNQDYVVSVVGDRSFVAEFEPMKYSVTVNGGTGGGDYDAGATVSISANDPAEGMGFDKWTVQAGEIELADASAAQTTFTMPAAPVMLTATYKPLAGKYNVTVNGGTGGGEYAEGDTVEISAAVIPGKKFTGWAAEISLADAKSAATSFIMPAADVEVTAQFETIKPLSPVLTGINQNIRAIALNWTKVENDLDGYSILRKAQGEKAWTVLEKGINALSFEDKDIEPGVWYYYYVHAENDELHGYNSNLFKIRCRPSKPGALTARQTANGVELDWSSADEGVEGVYYRVVRYDAKKKLWAGIKLGLTDTGFIDKNVKAGGVYYYRVHAYYPVGAGNVFSYFSERADIALS